MSLQLDGLLDQEHTAQLQAHLAECAACLQEWEAMRAVSQLLEAEAMVKPAPGFAQRVTRRVEKRTARRRHAFSILGVLVGSAGLWMAAGLVLAVVVFLWWRAPLEILWNSVAVPLASSTVSAVRVLLNALYTVAQELSRRPTAIILFGYAVLAFGLMLLWTQVVFRRGHQVTD
jgi:anti-sigma factor RsiW